MRVWLFIRLVIPLFAFSLVAYASRKRQVGLRGVTRALDSLLPGFRRREQTWNVRRDGIVFAVDIQASRNLSGHFTINWGVAPEGWIGLFSGGTDPAWYAPADCAVHGRLGDRDELDPKDRWWQIIDAKAALPADAAKLLTERLLPFFEGITKIEDIVGVLMLPERTRSWPRRLQTTQVTHATLAWLSGKREQGLRDLEAAVWQERARDVVARLRLKEAAEAS